MKSFAFFALAVLSASFVCAVEMPVVLKKTDVYAVSPENSVRLEGPMGQWLAQTLKGVESRDPDMLAYPFKARKETRLWKSEFWGKWFTSAVWAYRYSHSQKLDKLLRYSAAQIIKTQDAKGAIKTVTPQWDLHEMPTVNSVITDQSWDLWGRKYTLLGLLAEYERTGVRPDVIVVDPPRKGCEASLLHTMIAMAPERIVYVSCDPATLARDCRILCDEGYEITRVAVVDQFGHSCHIESVVKLVRK